MDTAEAAQTETNIDVEEARLKVQRAIHEQRMATDPAYAMAWRADLLKVRCLRTVPAGLMLEALQQGRAWERRERVKKLKADRDKLRGTQAAVSTELNEQP